MIGAIIEGMERGLLPDPAVRLGIRRLCRARLNEFARLSPEAARERSAQYVRTLKASPLAVETRAANQQHYELPAPFFQLVLGRHLKYSSAFWPDGVTSLDEAESRALEATCARAGLADGQKILELGCGWGSLSLYMASKFPNAKIVALSNSVPQRLYIEGQARQRGLANLTVLTRDINNVVDLEKEFGAFDRAVSVEMLEHLKNYEVLFERVARWLAPGGAFFVHIFTHREHSYAFDTEGDDNWMGRHFFTGGQMPGHDLLPRFQKDLLLENEWAWGGVHYAKTAEAWLANMDAHALRVREIFRKTYGETDAERWVNRWQVFFMACAELFGYRGGTEWGVSHYLFRKRP